MAKLALLLAVVSTVVLQVISIRADDPLKKLEEVIKQRVPGFHESLGMKSLLLSRIAEGLKSLEKLNSQREHGKVDSVLVEEVRELITKYIPDAKKFIEFEDEQINYARELIEDGQTALYQLKDGLVN